MRLLCHNQQDVQLLSPVGGKDQSQYIIPSIDIKYNHLSKLQDPENSLNKETVTLADQNILNINNIQM